MDILRIGSAAVLAAALAAAGCGAQEGGARVATPPPDSSPEGGPAKQAKAARTRLSTEAPKVNISTVP
jgi:hypothetical protein